MSQAFANDRNDVHGRYLAVYCIVGALCVGFSATIGLHGIPALRHDWDWAADRDTFIRQQFLALSPWNPIGLGSANVYINNAAFGAALLLLALLFGSYGTLLLLGFLIALVCMVGALRVGAAILGEFSLRTATFGAFAIANPWVYNEVVAGHLGMVLAYGGCLVIVGELISNRSSSLVLSCGLLATVQQSQFAIPAALAVFTAGVVRRKPLAIATPIVLLLPEALAIMTGGHRLGTIASTLQWQRVQSVSILDSIRLLGYAPNYTNPWPAPSIIACAILCACAVIGLLLGQRSAKPWGVMALLLAVFASGATGPIAQAYDNMMLHMSSLLVYRELYDVVGLIAVATVVLLAHAVRRFAWMIAPIALCTAALVAAWIVAPPSRYWCNGLDLPPGPKGVPLDTRFALLPAFQPLVGVCGGAGADPDAVPLAGHAVPLNTYFGGYPEEVALAKAQNRHDLGALRALAVSTVIYRPYYRELPSVRQAPEPFSAFEVKRLSEVDLGPVSKFVLQAMPDVGSLVNSIGAGNIGVNDAIHAVGTDVPSWWRLEQPIVPIVAPKDTATIKDGWVEASLGFARSPEIGQATGGALTTSPSAILPVPASSALLVWVDGSLLDAITSRSIATKTFGYRWIRKGNISSVRCLGVCVVAASAAEIPTIAENPPPRRSLLLTSFEEYAPWLYRVTIPNHHLPVLRFIERYDEGWSLLYNDRLLTHLRLDQTINGWIVPGQIHGAFWLVDRSAILQLCAELIALAWACVLLVALALRALLNRAGDHSERA